MKKLFKMVRQGNLDEIKCILEKNPALVNCIEKAPPKSDDGQSLLQVAIKRGSGYHDTSIISYLLDMGADVNFMEDDKGLLPYQTACYPVLMDMVYAVYHQTAWIDYNHSPEETKKRTNQFIEVFEHMLELGADPNKLNNRVIPVWKTPLLEYSNKVNIPSNTPDYQKFLEHTTRRLMDLMIAHGANIYEYPFPKDDPRYDSLYQHYCMWQTILRNLTLNRDLMYGLSAEYEVYTKQAWIELMRPYYAQNNPYYGVEVSLERKKFFEHFSPKEEYSI